jgi:hypothetical protein
MWENMANDGWKTAEHSTYAVPAQNASMSVPSSSVTMTGSALLKEVTLKDAVSEVNAKARIVREKR